jgi:uncharacterized membrane protein
MLAVSCLPKFLFLVKVLISIIILLVVGLGPSVFASTEEARALVGDEEKWKALQGGEAILLCDEKDAIKRGTKYALAAIIIESPVKPVWNVVCDKEAAVAYMKNLKSAKVLEQGREDGLKFQVVEQEVKPSLFPVTYTYSLKHVMQPYSKINFRRVSGEMKEVEGSWRFLPLEGGTKMMLVYELQVTPGKLIPGFVMRSSLRKGLPEALTSVRDRVIVLASEAKD